MIVVSHASDLHQNHTSEVIAHCLQTLLLLDGLSMSWHDRMLDTTEQKANAGLISLNGYPNDLFKRLGLLFRPHSIPCTSG
jgi:hypothetical protein